MLVPCSRLVRVIGLSALASTSGCTLARAGIGAGSDGGLDAQPAIDASAEDASTPSDGGLDSGLTDARPGGPLLAGEGSFMRTSSASLTERGGLVRFVPPHTARADAMRAGLTLVEGTRENLVFASERLTAGAWVRPASCTVTEDAALAPDGTMTADRQQAPNDTHCAFQTRSREAVTYTLSAWFRSDSDGPVRARGAREVIIRAMTSRDWARLRATGTVAAARSDDVILDGRRAYPAVDDPAIAQDVLSWGWQVEAGTFASSYIRTADGPATRAADVWVFAAANVEPELTTDRWTMRVEPEWTRDELRDPAWLVSFATDAGLRFRRTGTLMLESVVGGIPMAQVEVPEYALGDELRIEVDPRAGRLTIAAPGGSRTATGAAWTWTLDGDVRLGGRVGGTEEIYGWISVPSAP